MTRLYLVRHGPTHQKVMTGWRDVPADLSDGAAIARLSDYLPDAAPLVSSDLRRASATADCLSRPGRTRLAHRADLREFDFGLWDGEPFDALDPVQSRRFWDEPGDIAPPGGESWNAVARRVSREIDALTQDAPPALIVVAHMGPIMTQIARTGLAPLAALGHRIDPLSVTVLDRDGAGWRLERVNHRP